MRQQNVILFIYACFLVLIFLETKPASGQEIPDSPDQYVADYVDLLTPGEENTLNNLLRSYEDSTSNQMIVAIFRNAQGYAVEEFTIRVGEKWLVGQKSRDNGIILAVFMEERKIRIEVGYGLEDMVPDAVAIQIAQNVISPYFKEGQYWQGIFAGVKAVMQAAAGKFEAMKKTRGSSEKNGFPFVLLVFFFLLFLSFFKRKRFSSVSSRGYRQSGPFWWGGFGGGSHGGGFGGGGFGGGGFSGGGGSFGGGGATGSW